MEQEENKEVSDLLEEQFKPRIKLLNEILGYVESNDAKHLSDQIDRYHHALCIAIESYLRGLKSTREKIASLSEHPMDMEDIDKEIQKIETISQQLCNEYFLTLDKKLRFSTF